MLRLLWANSGAMIAQQEKLDSISNNLANISTTAYKKTEVNFEDLLYESLERRGYPTTDTNKDSLQNGTGVKASKWVRGDAQGSLLETGKKTDLALDGKGYFEVTLPNNQRAYTRDGSFNVDVVGNLVDKNGNKVTLIDKNGNEVNYENSALKLNGDNFIVSEDGEVNVAVGDKYENLGKIKVSKFVGSNSLMSIGDSLYAQVPGATVEAADDYSMLQGYLEQSNVDVSDEMTSMIMTQRAFQLSANSLKTADEMWGMVNNLRGR